MPQSETKVKEKEVMRWLQAQREGPDAMEFERTWKAWCKRHELNKLSKEDRIQRLLVFRQEVEDENEILSWLEAQRKSSYGEKFEAEWTKWSRAHNLKNLEKEDQIQSYLEFRRLFEASMEDEGRILGASKVTCPKGHHLQEAICGDDESFACDGCEVDISCGGKIFDCRACDYTLCVPCAQADEQKGAKTEDESLCQGPGAADSNEVEAQVLDETSRESQKGHVEAPSGEPQRGSCPKGHDLLEVVCGEAEFTCDACERDVLNGEVVFDCRTCDYCLCDACLPETAETTEDFPEGVWFDGIVELKDMIATQPLSLEAGNAEAAELLQSACSQRCKRMAGPLLFAGRHQSLVNTCLGQQNLCAVAITLSLSNLFPTTSLQEADLTRAVLEALCLESRGSSSESCTRVADALVDFVCLAGLSHFVAVGVTRCFSSEKPGTCREEAQGPEPMVPQESEEDARARRVQAQQQMRSAKRWDYTGGYRPAERETNEQATLRLISASHGIVPQKRDKEKQDPVPPKFKSAACIYFEKGNCFRKNCSFAHGEEELTAAREPNGAGQEKEIREVLPRRFKHDLCRRWEANGTCFKGEECTFAHGEAELQKKDIKGNVKLHQGPSWEAGPEVKAWRKKI